VRLAATDGWVSMPTTADAVPGYWPDTLAPKPFNMYVFGFRDMSAMETSPGVYDEAAIIGERGKAQISAPVLSFDEGSEVRVTLTNLGLSQRPDLVDGHTMHWHGFNNAIPIFDGVPEMSASVPIGKSITYLYRPHDAGTYMYHCHFEDVEHVQMGMTGLLFVRPLLNYESNGRTPKLRLDDPVYPNELHPKTPVLRYVFNDPTTRYDREFPLFLSENMPEDHFRDAHIQISDWSTYDPGFALFNGRAFPDTIEDSFDPMVDYDPGTPGARLKYQPQSARIDVEAGEKVLLRVAHLGSVRHTITVDGIPLTVVGADASQLIGSDATDNSYTTNSIDLGPGESRDVLFDAPAVGTYLVYDRNFMSLSNSGGKGYGGMLTHLVVHQPGTLGPQMAV
jgi:FtsP/CotA-like multicopper oxidase with cupredoxin domain